MVEGIRLVKFQKKIRDETSQKDPTSLIKKLRVCCLIDLCLFLQYHLSNSINNVSISGVKVRWTIL